MDHQIAMLWMRGSLSFLEQLCVQSFLDAGHHVVLYSYDPVGRVPKGVEHRDANEILPEAGFLVHERTGSPALHSDLFRYRLLARGDRVIWADTDAYCKRPFRPREGHLYGWESDKHVNGGVLGLPPDSPTLAALLEFTRDEFAIPPWEKKWRRREMDEAREAGTPVHVSEQTWGVWGPHAITHFLGETGEIARALPQAALYPYSFAKRRRLLLPGLDHGQAITDDTQSIHLYGRRVRKRMAERDRGLPDPGSLVGQLLIRHRIDPCDAPLRDCPDPDRDAPFARIYREAVSGRRHAVAALPEAAPVRPLDDVVIVTTMKNEGPFILDWVAYHLSVGVTHFLVYTNDCDDPTCQILDALAERGLVTRVDNPVAVGERPQRVALELAGAHPRLAGADAYIVMDVDEYINVHTGDGTLPALFAAAGDPDMISMTWRFFGSSGVIAYEDSPVPAQFTSAAPPRTRKPHQNWGFKTIVRRGAPFDTIGVHRPLGPTTDRMPDWTNGSGERMPDGYLSDGWRSNVESWGYDLVTLNHYAVRSLDSFLVKRDRGRTNHIARDQGVDYWNLYNRNDEEDASILPRLERSAAVRQVFALDPGLSRLHDQAVAWHLNRIAELKERDGFAELHAHLSKAPLSHEVDALEIVRAPVSDQWREAGTAQPEPEEKRDPQVTMTDDRADRPRNAFGDLILLGEENEHAFRALLNRVEPRHPMLTPLDARLPSERITVVTSMKNEGCFILEWIAHYLALGVTHFLVYTNDCEDPTDAILDRLQELGHVTRLDNPYDRQAGQKPQRGALNDAVGQEAVKNADWVFVADVDEFIAIHDDARTLPDLFERMGDPNIVSITWRLFGNAGQNAYEDRWITERFTACAPRYLPRPRLGWGFKSFVHRSVPYGKLGVHRPLDIDTSDLDRLRWVNGSGRVMPEKTVKNTAWFSRKASVGYTMATLNHYILRSAESFLVKRQRGRINHVDQDQGLAYWAERNYRSETDTAIHAQIPAARAVLANLMGDPLIARLHAEAVDWHRTRIATLMADPEYRALYDAITDPTLEDAVFVAGRNAADVMESVE